MRPTVDTSHFCTKQNDRFGERMNQQFIEELRTIVNPEWVHESEPMSKHTTFRVGGPADVLVQSGAPELPGVLELCKKYKEPYFILGNGSNLLVGDQGIRGAVIKLNSSEDDIAIDGEKITAGGGMLLSKAAAAAAKHSLAGMEFAAGIPGSIGGAVVMNAGAYGGEMKDIIESVTVLTAEGSEKTLSLEELELGYRKSCILKNGYIVLHAVLHLSHGDRGQIEARMKELREKRLLKQPLEYPSAGSTFKRPEGYYAGKLIMDAGLRGFTVGGAQVSEKHCGFVINRDHATAQDIVTLMKRVSELVQKQAGVALEPEVRMIGEFE